MSETIASIQWSASPAGSGSCTITNGTSGSFNLPLITASQYQNYIITASANAGWVFDHFEIDSIEMNDVGGIDSHHVTTPQGQNPYTSQADAITLAVDGAAWWWRYDSTPTQSSSAWIEDPIQVTAVFVPVSPPGEGPYLLYDDGPNDTGLLIYDDGPNDTGRLVYGGNLPN